MEASEALLKRLSLELTNLTGHVFYGRWTAPIAGVSILCQPAFAGTPDT
jgi:hypothetical protein